jgi:hypothetical protein
VRRNFGSSDNGSDPEMKHRPRLRWNKGKQGLEGGVSYVKKKIRCPRDIREEQPWTVG